MAKNVNVTSADFDGQALRDPINFKAVGTGRTAANSAGEDVGLSDILLKERLIQIQVSLNDLADALAMLTGKLGTEGRLILKTKNPLASSETTLTLTNAVCVEVLVDAQHNDYGAHVLLFETRYADGTTNPVTTS